ncbi:MAG: gliding motility-associated C-terminal domain-containing protein [Saprospiraceae bacterium]
MRVGVLLLVLNFLTFYIGLSQCLTLDVPDDVTICEPSDITLDGNILGNYYSFQWTSNLGFFDNTSLNSTAFVNATTTFTLTGYGDPNANIIVNGDFSSGNTGFTTDYTLSYPGYTCPSGNQVYGTLGCEGTYVIGTNSGPTHTNFADCYDHTGGGNMMMVNGAATLQNIWCQTLNVFPNTTYIFQAFATSIESSSPAILQFSIDGVLLGSPFGLSGATCNWEEFYTTWNSGSSTSVTICVTNQNTAAGGNDFALDDIFFAPLCEENLSFTVTYEPFDVVIPGIYFLDCNNPSTTIEAIPLPSSTGYGFLWETIDGVTEPDLTSPTLDVFSEGTYTVTVTDNNLCTRETAIFIDGNFDVPLVEIQGDTILNCTINTTELYINDIDGNETVMWTFPDNTTQSGDNITTNQTGVYQVVVTDVNGCSNSDQIEVVYDQNLIEIRVDSVGKLSCNDTLVPIILEITSPYTSIAWPIIGVDTILNNGLMAMVSDTGYYNITIGLGTDCFKVETIHVGAIPPSFNYNVNPVDTITCRLQKIDLQVQTSNDNVITWFDPSVVFENGRYYAENPGVYPYAVTDSLGCVRLDSTEIFANIAIPTAVVRIDSIDCKDNKGGFFIDDTNASDWYWLPARQFGHNIYAEFSSEGKYSLVLEGENGCSDTLALELPTNVTFPEITASVTDIDCSQPLGSIELVGNNDLKIIWQTSSGMNGTGSLITSVEGTDVTVTATDSQGCMVTRNYTISIDTISPKLEIIPPDTINCILTSVQPDVTASDYTKLHWSNLSSSQQAQLEPIFTEPGIYNLTLENDNGCQSSKNIEVFQDTAKPNLMVAFDTITCTNPVTLLAVNGWNNEHVLIKFPNDSFEVYGSNIELSASGKYTLWATAHNGCDTLFEFNVIEDKEIPKLYVEGANLDCAKNTAYLKNVSNDSKIVSYTWKDSDGNVIGTNENLNYTESGELKLEAISSNGCKNSFGPIIISADKEIPEGIVLGDTLLTCKDSLIYLELQSDVGNIRLQWIEGSDYLGTSPIQSVTTPGIYVVIFENLDNHCKNTKEISIASAPEIDSSDFELIDPKCYGDVASLIVKNIGGGTTPFSLLVNNETEQLNDILDIHYGSNTIQIEDTYGCRYSTVIDVFTPTPIIVDAGKDTLIQRGDTHVLNPNYSENTTSLTWESNGVLSCWDCRNPIVSPLENTIYQITVIDQNGCTAQDFVEIRVRFDKGFTAPNIIKLSSDVNNAFTLYSKYKSIGQIQKLSIFDRWGNMVFHANDIKPDDPSMGWKGIFNGQDVAQGVYVWTAKLLYLDGSEDDVAGDITVLK